MGWKRKNFIGEFRKFINRGNVLDMAVGVIIGSAFSKVVSSLVADVITPVLSLLTGKGKLTELAWVLVPAVEESETTAAVAEVSVRYGQFLQYILDFLVTALCVFFAVRIISHLRKVPKQIETGITEFIEEQRRRRNGEPEAENQQTEPALSVAPTPTSSPVPPPSDPVLSEIRDLLREMNCQQKKALQASENESTTTHPH